MSVELHKHHYYYCFTILFHTVLAVAILVGFFDGVQREFERAGTSLLKLVTRMWRKYRL